MASIGEVVYSPEYVKNVLSWLKDRKRLQSFRRLARKTKAKTVSNREIDRSLAAWGLF